MRQRLTTFGRRIAASQNELLPNALDFERARLRLLDAARSPSRRGVRWASAAVLAALLTALTLFVRREAPLEFEAGASPGNAGAWISAAENESVPILFSDGTRLALAENTRARVVDVSAVGATVIVERGELRASVVHREQARWLVLLGPFRVRVTGTKFVVAWQPDTELFSISVTQGSVLVTGPRIGAERAVRAGGTLTLSRKDGSLAANDGGNVGRVEPNSNAEPSARVEVPARPEPSRNHERVEPKSEPPHAADFRALARRNRFPEALAAAESVGFDDLCRTAPADDLMLLADAARLAGNVGRARQGYEAIRVRFPGNEAARAAFFLGRLAFDRSADFAGAARYFSLSVSEEPSGPLAREAAGRLIESEVRLGDLSRARDASVRYLERYPDGPHAETARKVLSNR